MNRYAAKLLFQFKRTDISQKYRLTEIRTINFLAENPESAIDTCNKLGESSAFPASASSNFGLEYVGILDLMVLGTEVEAETVWYECPTMLEPMERKAKILPSVQVLLEKCGG